MVQAAPIPQPAFTASSSSLDYAQATKLFEGLCEKPRDLQVESVARVLDVHRRGAKYAILEAPTGVGKTHIAMALAKHFKQAFVGTLTAQLQEQYASLFPSHGVEKLLGAGKFKCARIRGSCADGRNQGKDSCEKVGGCPYMAQKKRALAAPVCVGNFHSLLYNVAWAKGTDEDGIPLVQRVRPLMVADEVHAAENFLLGVTELTVRVNQFSFQTEALPGKGEEIDAYWLWLAEFEKQLQHELDEGHFPDPEAKEKAEEVKRKIHFALDAREEEQWIPERGEREDGSLDPTWFTLKPLTVKRWGHWLWGRGDFSLLMTATVISPGSLATGLGLDLNDGDYIEMPCPFPVENRPIYATRLDMSMRARDVSWPLMVQAIENLLNHHSAHKGLILTPSNKMMDYIMKGVGRKNAARLIPAAGEDREQKYKEHFLRRDASVLLASGFWEGADLAGDVSRFQIIPQLPRPFWAGQIKAHASIEPGWYEFKTWQKMIQGLGRSVRSDTDSAVSYVLDGAFLRELDKPKPLIPTWMRGAVKELA